MTPTTDHAKRMATVMHRRLSTPWMPKEIRAFRLLGKLDETDLQSLERYYRKNWPPTHGKNALRTDLYTLLNNFRGEVDRADRWNEAHPEKPKPRKIIPLPPTQSAPLILTDEDRARMARFDAERKARKRAS
jgi:hypothetical protein